jgi:hypothetical protein
LTDPHGPGTRKTSDTQTGFLIDKTAAEMASSTPCTPSLERDSPGLTGPHTLGQ